MLAFRKEFGKANLTSLVERRSRYTVLKHNPSRHSASMMAGIDRHLHVLPPALRRCITFDRGTEFMACAVLKARLDMTSYFCRPSATWQKGSVGNKNGWIRRFLPLDTDIALTSDRELQTIVDRLNQTPHKCLDYQTPHDVFGAQIALLKTG